MSLAGRIRVQGDTVDVYRPTYTTTASGNRKVSSWGSPTITGARMLLDSMTDQVVQKVFGGSSDVKARGFLVGLPDVQAFDVIKVTSGPREDTVFRVEDVRPQFGVRNRDHLEVSLQSTTEVIA